MQNSEIKSELLNGSQVYYSSANDMGHAFFSGLTHRFCFMLDGKVIFRYKNFYRFAKKLKTYTEARKMNQDGLIEIF